MWNSGTSGYTVYAQDQIAADVDRLRLMVYDWSIDLARSHLADVLGQLGHRLQQRRHVPPSKLQLGVPAYGRHWATQKQSTEVCPDGAL